MTQRLWMGSIRREESLQANTKRVVSEKSLMIMRNACCAAAVRLSDSSRITILWESFGSFTFS